MPATFVIDPDAKLDFGYDWAPWLVDDDTISSSSWTIAPTEPALTNSSHDTATTTIWVDGCVPGTDYTLTNHITTVEGREDDRTITLYCRQR